MESTNPLRTVFVNIGQMFYGLSLLTVASVEMRFHQDLGLHWLARPMSYLLAGLTLVLLVWSVVDALKRLAAERQWVLATLLAGIYLSAFVLAGTAFPTLILRK